MIVHVYGKTYKYAEAKLNKLIEEVLFIQDIKQINSGKNLMFVEMKNGDIYRAMPNTEGVRGQRWNRAFIDKDIDLNFLRSIILPTFRQRIICGKYEESKMDDCIIWY